MAAKIAGKQACLKTGQKCKRAFDGQYHRYGFHCHSSRLTKTVAFSRLIDGITSSRHSSFVLSPNGAATISWYCTASSMLANEIGWPR